MHLTFFNAGWSGDTAPGGLARLDRDVLSLRPTLVVACYGMNDGRYVKPSVEIRLTLAGTLRGVVKRLTAARTRVILLTPGWACAHANPALADVDYDKRIGCFFPGDHEG